MRKFFRCVIVCQPAKRFAAQTVVSSEQFDDKLVEDKIIKTISNKELKALYRPEFESNPSKYYPTQVFSKIGFTRHICPKCGNYYWRHGPEADTCGDSKCTGSYKFIGKKTGIGKQKKLTYAEAWKTFERSLTSARIPSKAIDRYPVVARWRNDVDYVAAGIYCFQPSCVTGEIEPPANPLICPQFCVRFNDLDNIGVTGRHYSGFVMLGIQAFNYPDKYVFFKEECVEFNHRWLTEELKIDPKDITYIEDIWAGGGNFGPSIEYFVKGMEIGNMVFMQYKNLPDGSKEELPIKIIDVGIGLERVPWLINGSATSYVDVFENAFNWLAAKLNVKVNSEVWDRFGPYSCRLNIDEVDEVEKIWDEISKEMNMEKDYVKNAINQIRELYIILDHTRTILMVIQDGSLPSNVGGGFNVRNMLRRLFSLLHKNDWWKSLGGIDGIVELCELHKKDLQAIYGDFKEYKSFKDIIKIEYERWMSTDQTQKSKLERILKKKSTLSIEDWVTAVTSWGISADSISKLSQLPIPGNLYYEISKFQEKSMKAPEVELYNTVAIPETVPLFEINPNLYDLEAKVLKIVENLKEDNKRNIVVLDKTIFYPTSGGQAHDIGSLKIKGVEYRVVNCEKVGKVIFHYLDNPITDGNLENEIATGSIDTDRRIQLKRHHTATHVIFASCREILGPHVWQSGAKKTVDQAHLDITHYNSLTFEQEQLIENEANRIILSGIPISKFYMNKKEAELKYGFRLYQGGIVPGNQLRVVNIEDRDVEACCGIHCDNTMEVGWIKLIKSQRIADGIVRLYFVAGEKALKRLEDQNKIVTELQQLWSVPPNQIISTGERFFREYKKLSTQIEKQSQKILDVQIKYITQGSKNSKNFVISIQSDATLYFAFLANYAPEIRESKKEVIFLGDNFIIGIISKHSLKEFEKLGFQFYKEIKTRSEFVIQKSNSKEKIKFDDYLLFSYSGNNLDPKVSQSLSQVGFIEAVI